MRQFLIDQLEEESADDTDHSYCLAVDTNGAGPGQANDKGISPHPL
jgi:hypothetical protein